MDRINNLMTQYFDWLKEQANATKIGEYYEINSPFLDSQNDFIQLYVKFENNKVYFTDDGFTINSLIQRGLNLTSRRIQQIKNTIAQFGITLEDKTCLVAEASAHNPEQRMHMFIQAMLRLDNIFSNLPAHSSSTFIDDISEFFTQRDIYCLKNVKFSGGTGFDHVYDFAFSPSKKHPERLCNAINTPSRATIDSSLFSWVDTKKMRSENSQYILLLNDENKIPENILTAISNYEATPILWSERNSEKNLDILAS